MVFNATFQQYFSYIVAVSFIGGGNRSTLRIPPIEEALIGIYNIYTRAMFIILF